MTVGELLDLLAGVDRYSIVTIGKGPGVLCAVTPAVNGFVILDGEPVTSDQLLAMQHVLMYQRVIESYARQSAVQRAK